MTDILSRHLTRLRKYHTTQQCLISMLKIWKKVLDQGGFICAIIMNLSNTFGT